MTNHPRPRRWIVVTNLIVILCLAVFQLFWFLPTMRKQSAYRERMESVFDASWECSQRAFATQQYEKVRPCFADWELWIQRNNQPDMGIDWPWATWKEAGR